MADGGVWKLQDDGYLNIDADPDSVIYHPNLNILIVLSRNAECIVVDINSGCVLRKCAFAEEGQPIKGAYLPSYDKVLLTDTKSVGVRSDYNGVLLLDTMLQTCLKSKNNPVKLEMLVSEAILLQQTLKTIETTGCEFSPGLWNEVLTELETKIEAAQSEPKKSAKSQKWNIICLELKHASFKTACYSLVCELKRQNRHVPALAIASAINERLNCLHPTPFPIDSQPSDHRNLMFSEAARRETFAKWPHMDYKWALPDQMAQAGFYHQPSGTGDDRAIWALPDQMAQAGFYHQPSGTGDDRAMCFTCIVCLVCWEPTDEPWAEHERHSPCCPFVKGEYTQNVPLSVTYATAPALAMTHALNPDSTLVDITTLPGYIPLISRDSTVLVLNYVRQLKVENEFSVSKLCYDYGLSHSELKVSAAAIAANVKHSSKASESLDEEHVNREETENVPRPCLIVGARLKTTGEDLYQLKQRLESGGNPLAMDTELTSCPPPPSSHLCLLVLDFHYRPNKSPATAGTQTSAPGNKKAVSGTGTSTATVGGGKLIQWEDKAIYHHPLVNELMDDDFLVTSSSPTAVDYIGPQPSTSNTTNDVPHSELKKELWSLLEKSDLCSMSLKKLRLVLESKLNCDLSQRMLEFGEIVSSYLEELDKKKTAKILKDFDIAEYFPEIEMKNSLNSQSYDEFDSYPGFDALDVDFAFEPAIKSLEAIGGDLAVLENALGKGTGAVREKGDAVQSATGSAGLIQVSTTHPDVLVTEIHLLSDCLHVLVLLSDGTLHLYALDHSEKVVKLSASPVKSLTPATPGEGIRKAILLPQDQSSTVLAGLTTSGTLVLMDVLKLEVLSSLLPTEGQEFVTLTYCNSLERICVATSSGSLRFYALRDEDEFRLREEASGSPVMKKKSIAPSSTSSSSSTNSSDNLIVSRASYGLPELRALYSLTLFETLSPGYSAAVPPCWSELMQAQKQRRHAQHLTREDIHTRSWRLQNDLTTWDEHMFELSLPKNTCVGQVDVKLTLHTPCPQVPPLQVTLLRPMTSRAPFQASHSGSYTSTPVDAGVSFSLPSEEGAKANPVTSDFYSNSEILCGPVNISNCLDLSDQSCTIAFSSPKLLKTKNRQLLVHIKALNFSFNKNVHGPHKSKSKDKDSNTGGSASSGNSSVFMGTKSSNSKSKDKDSNTGGSASSGNSSVFMGTKSSNSKSKDKDSNTGGSASSGNSSVFMGTKSSNVATSEFCNFLFGTGPSTNAKKSESFIGCDWIHEISITIRKSKTTDIPNERLERTALIESSSVVEKLLRSVTKSGDPVIQSIALDILIWIAVIRLGRLRNSQDNSQEQQFTFLKLVESQLGDFLHTCFIQGGRSIARKCAKFLIVCSDGMKNATDASKVSFDMNLLKVLVDLLPYICMSWSAGSVRWFFQMLTKVMTLDTGAVAAQRCLDILNAIGAQLTARQNPYHLILRTRFGLHGTPLEPELFEYEPYFPSRFQSVPVSFPAMASEGPYVSPHGNVWTVGMGNSTGGSNVQSTLAGNGSTPPQFVGLSSEPLDWRELLIPPPEGKGGPRFKGITVNHYMKGLLEVEPLHFTCHAMSDGTKLEKIDPQPVNPLFHMYSGGAAKSRSTQWNISIIDDDLTVSDDAMFSKLSAPIPWGVGPNSTSATEPKISSCDFFKTYMTGLNDFTDASTSTPPETGSSATGSATYSGASTSEEPPCSAISWSSLLLPPPQQVMVIERMHSGARRFIVLDFGRPILLTDLFIAACSELLSLSIDIWTRSEEADGIRLVVTPDIALKNLILSDIQPPPICRYLKITTIGRYGMSTAKCKIPVGSYYGHTLVLPGEDYADKNATTTNTSCDTNIKTQLQLLSSLYEDIYCRYSLCCTKLKDYMTPLLLSETPNVVHMHRYFNKKKENNLFLPEPKDKIISCYKECVTYQHQLNVVKSVIRRLSPPVVTKNDPRVLAGSSDKLRLIGECLLDSVLYYVYEIGPVPKAPPSLTRKFDEGLCSRLFSSFCVTEDTHLQVATAALLVATCGPQPWWGDFLTRRFCDLYSSQQSLIFPQDRILMLFSWLGRKNLALCASLVDSLLHALLTHLAPLANAHAPTPSTSNSPGFLRAHTDLSLITWLLLFLSQVLDCSCGDSPPPETNKHFGTRWDFMCGELAMQKQKQKPKASNSTCRSNRNRRLQKKLMSQNKDSSEKPPKVSSTGSSSTSGVSSSSPSSSKNSECLVIPLISLPRRHCLPSARAILAFILHLDYTCNVDTFLIACKDLSRIIISTHPTLSLPELLSEAELLHLLRLAVWSDQHRSVWGGPWTLHALTCLLLDMLDAASGTASSFPASSGAPGSGVAGGTASAFPASASGPSATSGNATLFTAPSGSFPANSGAPGSGVAGGTASSFPVSGGALPSSAASGNSSAFPAASASTSGSNAAPGAGAESSVAPGSSAGASGTSRGTSSVDTGAGGIAGNTVATDGGEDENSTASCSQTSQSGTQGYTNSSTLSSSPTANVSLSPYALPSVLESDDSDLEDFLDDVLVRGRIIVHRVPAFVPKSSMGGISCSMSLAMDSRLEYGVENNAEVTLKRLTAQSAYNLPISINSPLPSPVDAASYRDWDDSVTAPWARPAASVNGVTMLSNCFNVLFSELDTLTGWSNVEQILELWLTLNGSGKSSGEDSTGRKFNASFVPVIGLSAQSISTLIRALTLRPNVSLRTWCLSFETLTLATNTPITTSGPNTDPSGDASNALVGMARVIINEPSFVKMMFTFLSSSQLKTNQLAGPSVCVAFRQFLVRLQARCDILSFSSELTTGTQLNEHLLSLLYLLVQAKGPLSNQAGPLDVQCEFVLHLLHLHFGPYHLPTAMSILESVVYLLLKVESTLK
ncbi:hypothetical protein M8J75_008669 [Diaphorina citri]|nr:hypothetical protein M8J75_008669 [Diaphorina citri]